MLLAMNDLPLLVEQIDFLHQLDAFQRFKVFFFIGVLMFEAEAVVQQRADCAPLRFANSSSLHRVFLQRLLVVGVVIVVLIDHDVLQLFASEFFPQLLDEELLLVDVLLRFLF